MTQLKIAHQTVYKTCEGMIASREPVSCKEEENSLFFKMLRKSGDKTCYFVINQ